jgi:hypothetical protein
MRADLRRTLLGLALAAAVAGCEPSAEDLVDQGRGALGQRRFDVALEKFEAALKANPKDYDALWGKATVLEQQGKYAAQAELLQSILADAALAEKYGAVVKPALETSYWRQAEQATSDEQKEALLRRAIEVNERSGANVTLAKHFMARGDLATKRDDPAAAETAYKLVEALRVSKKIKREARTKAELAGFLAFKRAEAAKFEPVQNELAQAGQFDAAGDKFVVEGVADAEGDAKDADFEAKAELAARAAARTAIEDLTYKVSGKPRPDGATLQFDEAMLTVEEKGWTKKNKTYRVKMSLPRDAVIYKVFELERGIAAKPADDGPDDAPEDDKAAAPPAPGSAAAAPASP